MNAPATLTGLAVGDALGMPFEMATVSDSRLRAWTGDYEDGSRSPFTKELGPGQWTDDTKMARALTDSLLQEQGYSPLGAAREYLRWFDSGDWRGIGTSIHKAMVRLKAGFPWTQSGVPNAEGNGTAMRVAPIGLFYRYNIQAAVEMAGHDAHITHRSHEARVGSIAVAAGVACLLQRSTPETVISKVLEWLPPSLIRDRLIHAERAAQLPELRSDERALADAMAEFGSKAHVVDTVPSAFLALAATTSFKGAVRAAILCGGDTDTTGAVTGALAGTFYGIEEVAPFLEKLEDATALRDLEQRLSDAAPQVHL